MRTRPAWVGILVIIAVLLVISTVPGDADRGGHGYRGHGYRSHGHPGHGHKGYGHRGWHRSGGVRVFIGPSVVAPFGPYWRPYWEPYPYPPVVVAPSPPVYVEPAPPTVAQLPPPPQFWYYCDASQAYYPYVQECPEGWRPVSPTPQ
jgi:hypothetical protein